MRLYFENPKDGYSCKDTILTYNLEGWQLDILNEVIKIKEIKGRRLKIFLAEDIIDVIAIPHFMAFLNFAGEPDEDRQTFFDFWMDCISEMEIPDDANDEDRGIIKELRDIRMNVTYVLNCSYEKMNNNAYLYLNSEIFEDKAKLRLTVIHEIKEIEKAKQKNNEMDWGWRSDKGNSMKQRRLLLIYGHLLSNGWINKKIADKLCASQNMNPVSNRSFLRDLEVIRSIGEKIGWNKDNNRYERGRITYTHTDNM